MQLAYFHVWLKNIHLHELLCPSRNKAGYTAELSRAIGQEQLMPESHKKERNSTLRTDGPTDGPTKRIIESRLKTAQTVK